MNNDTNINLRITQAHRLLTNLHVSQSEIEASAIVSGDGITLTSLLGPSSDKDRFGAMCASLLALASRAGKEVHRGHIRQLILDGSAGPMLLTHIGTSAVLAVAATPKANLGYLILGSRKTANELKELLETVSQAV